MPITGTLANSTGLDWVAPLGNDAARVSHLLRRFTFGASAEELEKAQADGYARTVDRLLETKIAEPPVLAGADEASQEKPLNPGALQQWWIDWMLASPTPFAERMTLFWHGHFTSDFRKVGNQFPYLYWQNLTWRKHALADLKTMLFQVTIDPAMLRYLDLGSSTARNPNENYSRELMELFTMGPDAFTEDDVRAGATALSGWREPLTQAMVDANLRRAEMRGQTLRITPKADTVKTGDLRAAARLPRRAAQVPRRDQGVEHGRRPRQDPRSRTRPRRSSCESCSPTSSRRRRPTRTSRGSPPATGGAATTRRRCCATSS